LARPGFFTDGGGHAVGAENQDGALGNFFDGCDKNGTAPAQLLDHVRVMYDFVVHVDGRTIGFQRQFHDVHGADHTGAEAARPHPEQYFSILCVLHGHPSWSLSEDSIIPHTPSSWNPVSTKGISPTSPNQIGARRRSGQSLNFRSMVTGMTVFP